MAKISIKDITPIKSIAPKVLKIENKTTGKSRVLAYQNNYHTMYAHLNSINVSVGQTVSKGTIIGKMGETGRATGVHLHFSVSIGEPYSSSYKYLNPLTLYR